MRVVLLTNPNIPGITRLYSFADSKCHLFSFTNLGVIDETVLDLTAEDGMEMMSKAYKAGWVHLASA